MNKNLTPEAQVIESMFSIINKDQQQVDFLLKPGQAEYDIHRTTRDLIPKSRQEGFSSLGIGYQVVDCLTKYGSRCVLISHESEATKRLLGRADYYLRTIKGVPAQMGRHSQNEMFFPKTESTYYIGTAGAKSFGRGDTISHLHISEYAWWEGDALKKIAGLFQAVPLGGTIRVESTGNGRNNDFYYMCQHAEELGYHVHFHPWYLTPEYTLNTSKPWFPRGFEKEFQDLKSTYNLTPGQLYWYWVKLLEFRMDFKTLKQEYPSSLDECFQATGGAVFPNAKLISIPEWTWKRDGETGIRYEYHTKHPQEDMHYVLGGDPSGGTGNDGAAIVGLCVETLEEVLEFNYNLIDPVGFAILMMRFGFYYNLALLVPEANKHGAAVVPLIVKEYPSSRIYASHIPKTGTPKYGFTTTQGTKNFLVGQVLEMIDDGLVFHGQDLEDQLKVFEEDKNNQGTFQGLPHDDLVMALGLACVGVAFQYRYHLQYQETQSRRQRLVLPKTVETYEGVKLMHMTYEEIFKKRLNPIKGSRTLQEMLRRN